MYRLISLLGIFFLIGIGVLLSENKKKIKPKVIFFGIGLQFLMGLFILKTPVGVWLFKNVLNKAVNKMLDFTTAGAEFVFGDLLTKNWSFALKILPTIIFFSSFFAVLYYFGILQKIVKIFAIVLRKILGTSGAESLSTAANVFMGQTEAPLMVKPYVEGMTRSELLCIMTGGMATVAGGVLAAYVSMGVSAGHLIAASVMNAPAAIVMAKIIAPEEGHPVTSDLNSIDVEIKDKNALEAASRGAGEGLFLALNVAAMLLAFIAFVWFFNYLLGFLGTSMQEIFGFVFKPIAFMMGVPWEDAGAVGTMFGEKTAINEFVAYMRLGKHIKAGAMLSGVNETILANIGAISSVFKPAAMVLSERAVVISTFALCGFANFSSIAIQLGGIGGMAPKRRGEIASLGIKAMLGGAIATFLSATIAGILL